LIGNP
jgi:serine/threonine protein kinase